MEKIITLNFGENFIERCADFILDQSSGNDLSRTAVVFGGKRPALFLRRALARKIKMPFYPPRLFSMDEFISEIAGKGSDLRRLSDLDAAFLIFSLARDHAPEILEGRDSFSEFLPWAGEMVSFIEQLDLEDIPDSSLAYIEESAAIGYEVPENINVLLRRIIQIRSAFHQKLKEQGLYSRGLLYKQAAAGSEKNDFTDYDRIIFANFFYLHRTEQTVLKTVLEKGKGTCIFQGSQSDWSVLAGNAKVLGSGLLPENKPGPGTKLSFYRGFDLHSQVGLVRAVLKKIPDRENTLVLVPRPETVIPLLTEISPLLKEFNVSMGYPLKRTSLYTLFDLLLKVQENRKKGKYYTRDYLNLLRHPLIKNLNLDTDPALTRVLIHKLEELLEGKEESTLGGNLFLDLDQIEAEEKIYDNTLRTLGPMGFNPGPEQIRTVLSHVHDIFLRLWEDISDFKGFSLCLNTLLSELVEKSMLTAFPFNLKVVEKMQKISEEFVSALFRDETFDRSQLWDIFKQKLEREKIAFVGSPLRGTQILGLFETRSLDFKNVIVMDMNESILPKLKLYEPLIPREVMLSLGLNRLEKEEEIQRYQFMRLISSAREVHLVYEENAVKEKSRFIEGLLWQKQKEKKSLYVTDIPGSVFPVKIENKEKYPVKTGEILAYLKECTYSASRLNTYLNCPLQFYFKYVLGLKEQQDLLDDPQASHIGTFIHELLEQTFMPFTGRKPLLDEKFRKEFFRVMEDKFDKDLGLRMKSDSVLLKRIIRKRLESFLRAEQERDVARIICLEENRNGTMLVNGKNVKFTMTADRIDLLEDNSVVIVDYKTGGSDIAPGRISVLEAMDMTRESIRTGIKSFQLPIYFYFICRQYPEQQVNAELYNIRTLKRTAFLKPGEFSRKDRLMDICLKAMETIFSELFNPAIPFIPAKEDRLCSFCPYKTLCR